jgi:hypothetical protein
LVDNKRVVCRVRNVIAAAANNYNNNNDNNSSSNNVLCKIQVFPCPARVSALLIMFIGEVAGERVNA